MSSRAAIANKSARIAVGHVIDALEKGGSIDVEDASALAAGFAMGAAAIAIDAGMTEDIFVIACRESYQLAAQKKAEAERSGRAAVATLPDAGNGR